MSRCAKESEKEEREEMNVKLPGEKVDKGKSVDQSSSQETEVIVKPPPAVAETKEADRSRGRRPVRPSGVASRITRSTQGAGKTKR